MIRTLAFVLVEALFLLAAFLLIDEIVPTDWKDQP